MPHVYCSPIKLVMLSQRIPLVKCRTAVIRPMVQQSQGLWVEPVAPIAHSTCSAYNMIALAPSLSSPAPHVFLTTLAAGTQLSGSQHDDKTKRPPAFPAQVLAWFAQHEHTPTSSKLYPEYEKVLRKLGLDRDKSQLNHHQWARKRSLQESFARACASEFAEKAQGLPFLQSLCVRYSVKVGNTKKECIRQLDKVYVNIHDAVLKDGNSRQFKSWEDFQEDVRHRTFSRRMAKQLGLRVFLKNLWEDEPDMV